MRSASMRVRRMNDDPVDLDKHRGMAAQKATDIRRVVADIEANAKLLRDHRGWSKPNCLRCELSHGPRQRLRRATC